MLKRIFFWQPKFDYFHSLSSSQSGRRLLVVSNYSIWLFFLIISFLLINHDPAVLWQLFIATFISEIIEKFLKTKCFWPRPFCRRHHTPPKGLITSWYLKGSFPSGHTIKVAFFFLFILYYPVISPELFLLITSPLIFFRVISGFHYPVDVIGGGIIGLAIGSAVRLLPSPDFFTTIGSFIGTLKHVL